MKANATDIDFNHLSLISTTSPQDVIVHGEYLYIADLSDGFVIYDISNKSNPSIVQTVAVGNATDLFISGSYAFVTSNNGLSILDISIPATAYEISSFSNFQTQDLKEVTVIGDMAIVRDGTSGVLSIDVSNFFGMSVLDNFAGLANSIWTEGYFLYIASNSTMQQISISGNSDITDVQTGVKFWDFVVQGQYGYAAAGMDGLVIYQTNNFQIVNSAFASTNDMIGISVFGSHAFIAQDQSFIRVVDISNPDNPVDIPVNGGPTDVRTSYVGEGYIVVIDAFGNILIQSWDLLEAPGTITLTNTLNVTLIETSTTTLNVTTTETQNQTITPSTTITFTDVSSSTHIFNVSLTRTIPTYLETATVTNTKNTTITIRSTSSALTENINFTSTQKGDNAGIPSFVFFVTLFSFISIYSFRKLKE